MDIQWFPYKTCKKGKEGDFLHIGRLNGRSWRDQMPGRMAGQMVGWMVWAEGVKWQEISRGLKAFKTMGWHVTAVRTARDSDVRAEKLK